MKTSLEQEDIQQIAAAVFEMLKPVLSGNGKHEAGDAWLNVKALASYIGMSPQWVYNNRNKLPHVNIGNKPLFRRSEIDEWLLKQRVGQEAVVMNIPKNRRSLP